MKNLRKIGIGSGLAGLLLLALAVGPLQAQEQTGETTPTEGAMSQQQMREMMDQCTAMMNMMAGMRGMMGNDGRSGMMGEPDSASMQDTMDRMMGR